MQNDFDKWAEIYDQVYSDVFEDIHFYKNLAYRTNDKILEIGCGTGRITIPIAKDGHKVVGIDISESMLAILKNKIKNSILDISCHKMDMKNINIKGNFSLVIIPFNGFQSMLDISDQYECLSSIRAHMHSDSNLVLDMFPPSLNMFDQNPQTWYQVKEIISADSSESIMVKHSSKYLLESQLIHTKLMIEEIINCEIVKTVYKDFSLRYTNRYESEYLFKHTGFKIENLYGNFNLDKFDENSDKMIWILKPQGKHIV